MGKHSLFYSKEECVLANIYYKNYFASYNNNFVNFLNLLISNSEIFLYNILSCLYEYTAFTCKNLCELTVR